MDTTVGFPLRLSTKNLRRCSFASCCACLIAFFLRMLKSQFLKKKIIFFHCFANYLKINVYICSGMSQYLVCGSNLYSGLRSRFFLFIYIAFIAMLYYYYSAFG